MSSLIWFCVGFGTAVGVLMIFVVIVDVWYIRASSPTISRRVLTVASRWPIIAGLMGAALGLLTGALMGHLFFPQFVGGP